MEICDREIYRHYLLILRRAPLPAELMFWRFYPGVACSTTELRRELASGREFETELLREFRQQLKRNASLAEIEGCRTRVVAGATLDEAIQGLMAERSLLRKDSSASL